MKTPIDFAIGKNTRRLSLEDYQRCAGSYNIETELVQAIVKVEAGTAGFWASDNMKLLYEGHIAYKETSGDLRARLVKEGLAWRSWGDVPYGKASLSRERLRKAIDIAGDQAYRWASYGLGQVMGFNAVQIGYPSAKNMFEKFLTGEPAQLEAIMRFIRTNNILQALRDHNWHKVARIYNGSGYQKHNYHGRLEQAYLNFKRNKPELPKGSNDTLSKGDKGSAVLKLQLRLNALGARLEEDGHFGMATEQAVKHFQRERDLLVDGIVGPQTQKAISTGTVEIEDGAVTADKVSVATSTGLLDFLFRLLKLLIPRRVK